MVTLLHRAQKKHEFWGEINQISKTKKFPSRKEIALEMLHQILCHRSTIFLMAGDTDNFGGILNLDRSLPFLNIMPDFFREQ